MFVQFDDVYEMCFTTFVQEPTVDSYVFCKERIFTSYAPLVNWEKFVARSQKQSLMDEQISSLFFARSRKNASGEAGIRYEWGGPPEEKNNLSGYLRGKGEDSKGNYVQLEAQVNRDGTGHVEGSCGRNYTSDIAPKKEPKKREK